MEPSALDPESGTRRSRAQRFWTSFALLVVIVLLVYTAARVLTAMGDQVPPAREPLPSGYSTLDPAPSP